jgi:hypothetical protein
MKTQHLTATFLLALGAAAVAGQDAPARDPQARDPQVRDRQVRDEQNRQQAGSGAIGGTVMSDESSPQPVRAAQVQVTSSDFATRRTVYTDSAGRFGVDRLPAGRYNVQVTKPGWVRMSYGARGPDRPGTPITVADGAKVADVAVRLPRGAVITGMVVDEHGLPAYGAQVRVMQYRMQQGERVLMPVVGGGPFSESADDRGMYRLYGLPAGEYVVTAAPRVTLTGEVQAMSDAEIRAALQALQQPQQPGAVSPPPAPAPAPERDMGTTVAYAPVFYPGTTSAANAATITLAAGEERTGVDFALQLVRTARLEGVVTAPAGVAVQSTQLMLMPKIDGGGILAMPPMLMRATPGPDGRFSYNAVPPGQYTISARASAGGGPGGEREGRGTFSFTGRAGGGENVMMIGGPGGPAYWAQADVTVDGEKVADVGLALQPGMKVGGKIEFRGTRAIPPADLTRVRLNMVPAPSPGGTTIVMGVPMAEIDPTGRFAFDGVTPGRYRISGTVPIAPGSGPAPQWTLKSVMVKGRDALDFPFEVAPNDTIGDAVITFTDATQEVSGSLQDPSGRPAPDYTIVVFPADQQYWTVQRRIRTTRPGTDGKFTIAGLPPGEYRMAAVVDVAPNEASNPSFLEQLVAASYQFTLAEGEKKQQDLRIAG